MDIKIVTALIAAVASLVVSLLNTVWGRRNQRDLEALRARLTEERAERDARRDYEYDARKRLYEECEPLFFQINEAAENAMHRILSLARTSRISRLGFSETSWVSRPGYYLRSTIYKLMAPLAIFKQIQQRLTLVDLTVDPLVKARYELMKWLYLSYTDDFEFARSEPSIVYEPDVKEWERLRQADQGRHWKQGIPYGLLDNAVESLIVKEASEPTRSMSFGEFEQAFVKHGSVVAKAFDTVTDVFLGFDPRTRPVLWRILIAQAHLCLAIIRAGQMRHDTPNEAFRPLQLLLGDEREPYDWREKDEEISDEEVFQPFTVARKYFEEHLPHLVSWDRDGG